MMNNRRLPIWIVIFAIGLFPGLKAWASVTAQGSFAAEQACQAYISKNKQTNPDRITLTAGVRYPVFEVNRAGQPTWYRIRIEAAQPAERWVNGRCGTAHVQIGEGGDSTDDRPCRSAGHADSYKLALSWQPAFCEGHPSKPECRAEVPSAYQARNFVLHGLWPNRKSCGTRYGFCGKVRSKPGHFCDYPVLNLHTQVRRELEQVMPSAAAGSCLQRHEWFKHGTCQTRWPIDGYFEEAVDLTRQFNESGVGYFMARNIGKEVSETAFFRKVDYALGEGAHKRLQLTCRNGNLVDVYINLPATIARDEDLGEAIARARPGGHSNCGGRFRIDPVGLGN